MICKTVPRCIVAIGFLKQQQNRETHVYINQSINNCRGATFDAVKLHFAPSVDSDDEPSCVSARPRPASGLTGITRSHEPGRAARLAGSKAGTHSILCTEFAHLGINVYIAPIQHKMRLSQATSKASQQWQAPLTVSHIPLHPPTTTPDHESQEMLISQCNGPLPPVRYIHCTTNLLCLSSSPLVNSSCLLPLAYDANK